MWRRLHSIKFIIISFGAHTARYHTMVHFNNWTIKILNSHKIRFNSFYQNKVIRIVSGIYVCVYNVSLFQVDVHAMQLIQWRNGCDAAKGMQCTQFHCFDK